MSTSSNKPRVLCVTAGSPRKSSFVARLAWLSEHPACQFAVIGVCSWPYEATAAERNGAFTQIQSERRDADLVVLHRVLFERDLRETFFSQDQPTIFDFDDAIYAVPSESYSQELRSVRGWLKRGLRLASRFRSDYSGRFHPLTDMLRRVSAVSAGNSHLAGFASRYCASVSVVPTVVDAERFPTKTHSENGPVTIGWYGSPDNHWYLARLGEVFRRIQQQFGERVRFEVISAAPCQIDGVHIAWTQWQADRELRDMLHFDIGVMPLTEDEWSRGKCGNKAIYYMAAGIPPVVSPVGMNASLVEHASSGFLARNHNEWTDMLSQLVRSAELRRNMGANAKRRAIECYSRNVAAKKMSALVKTIYRHA